MQNEFLTASGKPLTVTAAFRLPISRYQQALELAKRRGETLSAYTARLWLAELEQEGTPTPLPKMEAATNGRN